MTLFINSNNNNDNNTNKTKHFLALTPCQTLCQILDYFNLASALQTMIIPILQVSKQNSEFKQLHKVKCWQSGGAVVGTQVCLIKKGLEAVTYL